MANGPGEIAGAQMLKELSMTYVKKIAGLFTQNLFGKVVAPESWALVQLVVLTTRCA